MTNDKRLTAAKLEYTNQLRQYENVSFTIWLLNRAEAAEARAATNDVLMTEAAQKIEELRAERDKVTEELSELRTHHANIIMTLYAIDNDVFGPLTVKEGIAELLRQRDALRASLDAEQAAHRDDVAALRERIDALVAERQA